MNSQKLKHRFKHITKFILLIINILCIYNSLFSQNENEQGLPFLKNFNLENYSFISDQTWAITQDANGIIYFGNNNGIIEYDGSTFRLLKIGDDVEIRSLGYDKKNDLIYVGAASEFGYLAKSDNGDKIYKCLSDSIPSLKVKTTWKTFVTADCIYFIVGKNKVVKYSDKKLIEIENPENANNFRGFLLKDTVILADETYGFLSVTDNTINKLDFGYEPAINDIRAIVQESDSTFIILTTKKGIYRWTSYGFNSDKNKIEFVKTAANNFLTENLVYSGIKFNDLFLISTLRGGLIILDKNFKITAVLNKSNGLPANGIYFMFSDSEKNIWVGSEKGLSMINVNFPFRKFSDLNGLNGIISSINRYKNVLYVGTYDGLFYLSNKSFKKFNSKEIFITQLYNLHDEKTNKDALIGASLRNIIQIYDTVKLDSLATLYSCYSIINSTKTKNKLFFGHYNGLSSYEYSLENSGKLKFFNEFKFKDINYEIHNLIYDKRGNIWGSTSYNGIFVVEFKDTAEKEYVIHQFDINSGLPSKIGNYAYLYKDKLIIATRDGVYTVENDSLPYEDFKFKATDMFGFSSINDSISIYSLNIDKSNNIWFITSEGLFKYLTETNRLSFSQFKYLSDIQKDNIVYTDSSFITWISMKDVLYSYNDSIETNFDINNQIVIRRISCNNSDIYSGNFVENNLFSSADNIIKYKPKIDYRNNNLTFEYSLPFYNSISPNLYSTFLDGYNTDWSDWGTKTEISFSNLKSGKYIFYVKAKNIYNNQSEVIGFEFVIKPPFYRTILAYIIYFLVFVLLVQLFFKLRTKKIIRDKNELEQIVKLRTAEIEQQKEEINAQSYKLAKQTEILASQTEKLGLSNNELKHLSLVAQETDNSVVLLDKRGRFEWWNKGFTQLFNYRFEKYKDADFKTKQKMLRPDLQREIKNYTKDKGTIKYTAHDIFENGQEVWYQTTINPVYDESGEVFRFVAIDFDITKHKLSEIEINNQKEEIQYQAEKLRYNNIELSKQSSKIERQNKEITDSILYAKRIQEAMLPLQIFIEVVLPENFILFKPRDIVSGDFYWIAHKNGKTFLAVADCTGHGIPGAFMSLLGISALKEIITRFDNISSNEILNILREQIIVNLHQRGKQGEATDGMDIALCVFDEKNMKLQYSGANNPLVIIKKLADGTYDLIRYKPDKMPIGIHYNVDKSFSKTDIDLESKDTFYMFTDGYVDQFGESEDKKFLSKNFKKLLFDIQDKNMAEQKEILNSTIEKWKGRRHQVDDILIMGIRLA